MAIRRDVLKRMVEKGEMEASSVNLANNFTATKWFPARIKKEYGDFKEGYMNLTPFDFKSKSGHVREDKDGTITMGVHSNQWFHLRKRKK